MTMEVRFPGGVQVDAVYRDHTIRTDQTERSGGTGSAPSPFDLFLASIATCAGYYALAFCRERNLPTLGLGLRMDWERDAETGMISRLDLDLSLPEGFPEKYRRAIVRAMDQCTVKKHLVQAPEITVEIVDG